MFNVYGIFCKTTYKVYYGSTEETIKQRLSVHKSNYKSYLEGNYNYITSYEILKNNNYEIKLLEKCDNKIHMIEREGYYIRTFACVNKNIPGRTKKEYYKDNKEEIAEKMKGYYKDNKEKISEKRKGYYEDNREKILGKNKKEYTCPCGSTLTKWNKTRHEKTNKHQNYLKNL